MCKKYIYECPTQLSSSFSCSIAVLDLKHIVHVFVLLFSSGYSAFLRRMHDNNNKVYLMHHKIGVHSIQLYQHF